MEEDRQQPLDLLAFFLGVSLETRMATWGGWPSKLQRKQRDTHSHCRLDARARRPRLVLLAAGRSQV